MRLVPREMSTPAPEPYVVPPSQEFDGSDGSWSTFKISVGTPGQESRVLVSTKSGETYIIVPDGCSLPTDPPDCPNLRGAGILNSAQSPGFLSNVSSSWSTIGQYDIDLEESLNNYTARGFYGYDRVLLGSAGDSDAISMDHQVVAGVAETNYFLGHIPVGVPDSSFSTSSKSIDSFLYQLRNNTKIPSLSFAYTAGAKYRLKSVPGQLILGGYDSTRFTPNDNDYSFAFSTDPSRLLTVGVDSITATNTLQGTYSLSSGGHFSLVDSTVSHLWLPRDICDAFESAFGLTYDSSTDLYRINDTMHDQVKARNPSVTIKLVNSLEDTSTNYTNIVLPYSAFDLQASYPWYPNATNYFPIRRAANDTQYTLGRTLLQEAYLVVDYERANFTIAQTVWPDPLPAAKYVTLQPPGASSDTSKSGLSTGVISGIAVGSAALLIALALGAFFFRRRRNIRNLKYELANTQLSGAVSPAPYKQHYDPQELSETQLAELGSSSAEKSYLSANNVPQELPAVTAPPTCHEVGANEYFEMEGESAAPKQKVSQMKSAAPSDDGRYTGVSPLPGKSYK